MSLPVYVIKGGIPAAESHSQGPVKPQGTAEPRGGPHKRSGNYTGNVLAWQLSIVMLKLYMSQACLEKYNIEACTDTCCQGLVCLSPK